jgi:ADP-ribose pyrophosphatase YjhB (NUDIX family)
MPNIDIDFTKNNLNFSIRCSAIIKDKDHNHIIVSNMRAVTDHEAFLLPGGRINILEPAEETIKREIKEELNITLSYKLIAIEENISKTKKMHMLEFVYYAEIDDFNNLTLLDDGWDKFKIIALKDLANFDIRPKSLKALIKQDQYPSIIHYINYDWL